jgi:hypothetical protein
MRVLIADRNARLLESISRSFGREFAIQAAASCADCKELLSQGEFDLALISEKLADGPGLQLLGQIARDSPDTLRVFVARRARLELLRGKLGPFGLFRTLGYPIDPQELLSVLTLARAGLEVSGWRKPADAPVMAAPTKPATGEPAPAKLAAEKTKVIKSPVAKAGATGPAVTGPAVTKLAAAKAAATDPAVTKLAATKAAATKPAPAPAGVRATVERISLTSADATFVVDVPKIFASIGQGPRGVRGGRVRAPGNGAPRPKPSAQKSDGRDVTPDLPRAAGRAQQGASDSPAAAGGAQRGAPDPSAVAGKAGKFAFDPSNVPGQGLVAASSAPSADPRRTRAQPSAPRSSLSPAAVGSKPRNRGMGSRVEYKAPVRSKVALGATIAVVFVVTALTLNWADTSAHVTRAPAPGPTVEQSALAVPPPPPVDSKPPFGPTSSVARRVEPKPDPVQSDAEPTGPQIASSTTTPVADPSSFGSEAYEIIYSN